MSEQIIFSRFMESAVIPPNRQILKKHISFSTVPKSVLGLNGSGKSTLLKVIAGLDKITGGEVSPGYSVNVRTRASADPTKSVKEVVEEGAGSGRFAQRI
jgi:ATPase subunit of ABC transporter with duplicated ATPase domains